MEKLAPAPCRQIAEWMGSDELAGGRALACGCGCLWLGRLQPAPLAANAGSLGRGASERQAANRQQLSQNLKSIHPFINEPASLLFLFASAP